MGEGHAWADTQTHQNKQLQKPQTQIQTHGMDHSGPIWHCHWKHDFMKWKVKTEQNVICQFAWHVYSWKITWKPRKNVFVFILVSSGGQNRIPHTGRFITVYKIYTLSILQTFPNLSISTSLKLRIVQVCQRPLCFSIMPKFFFAFGFLHCLFPLGIVFM